MQKRFGPVESWDYDDRSDQIWDWVCSSGEGVMGFVTSGVPQECMAFCLSQYERFGIPMFPELNEIVEEGARQSLYYIDYYDPYTLFCGISDVDVTMDWSTNAYEIIEEDKRVVEAQPEYTETFVFVPGQAEESFNYIMSHPGLEGLQRGVGVDIKDMVRGTGYCAEESCFERLSSEGKAALLKMCTDEKGVVNEEMMWAYFDLAAWASFAWIVGPESRAFRAFHHDIFHVVYQYGEAILVDGNIICPTNYRKLARPPKSCHICGVASWCVELTMVSGDTRHICESCLSADMPKMSMATCGTKFCLLSICPHHPNYHLGASGIGRTMREYGQLGAMARGESILRIQNQNTSSNQLKLIGKG